MSCSERAWYISVTAPWTKAQDWSSSKSLFEPYAKKRAAHHITLPDDALHCTILSVLQVTVWPEGWTTEEYMETLLTALQDHYTPPKDCIILRAHELRCYDDSTSVQLRGKEYLAEYRRGLLRCFEEPVIALRMRQQQLGLELTPILLSSINVGTSAHGALARSPCKHDADVLRWKEEIAPCIQLTFDPDAVVLAASDKAETRRIPAKAISEHNAAAAGEIAR